MTKIAGRKGQILSQGFASGRSEMGLRTTMQTKKIGCAIFKRLVEEDKILINDERIIHEMTTFVAKSNSFKAEEGHNDDLVMCLIFFSWLTRQEYYSDLIETARMNYEEAKRPEDDNILIIPDDSEDEDGKEFVNDGAVWYPA